MSEFSLIDSIRARCAHSRRDVALGIGDDAALLDVPAGQQLVACTDTLVEGVHFLRVTAPEDLGWKSLAVNLSDLAAMGAEPAWALLAMTLPAADMHFVTGFTDGFAAIAREHAVALVGGDTTQGPLTVTVTALGFASRDAALTRTGARPGDAVFVTGTLGDAAGALWKLRDGGPGAGGRGMPNTEWLRRLHRPQPRVAAGLALRGVATACIDVSDGLLVDLGHVCTASGVGAEIKVDTLPLSQALTAAFDTTACRRFALSGGDDYELCFTVPQERIVQNEAAFARLGLRVTRIGRILGGNGVRVLDVNGEVINTPRAGWEHFTQ